MINKHSWGNLAPSLCNNINISNRNVDLFDLCKASESVLPRGNGRSYGDVCTNTGHTLLTNLFLNKLIDFDPENQTVTVESGVMLKDLQRFLVKRGFMLPVTPGTQLITVGGAIANDVHCKNHHKYGTFGNNLVSFVLKRTDGEVLNCSLTENEGFFRATLGGIGLTGFITQATLKLRTVTGPMIDAENIPYKDLKEFFELAKASETEYEHHVSWIDCITGNGERGVFMRGNNATESSPYSEINRNIAVPMMSPFSLVNQLSLFGFNKLYYFMQTLKNKPFKVHYEKFFYPLDNILQWNYIYGPSGFFQYQFVVPMEHGYDAVKEVQKEIARSKQGSFLGVLKTFGKVKSLGYLSFPEEGWTYALDFPNRGVETNKLLDRLDSIVKEAKGRLYLAKDVRQPRSLFEQGYGDNISEFLKYRDPKISSDLSRRLLGI